MGQDKNKVKKPKSKTEADLDSIVPKKDSVETALAPIEEGKTVRIVLFGGHSPGIGGDLAPYVTLKLDDGQGQRRLIRAGGSDFQHHNVETIEGDGQAFLVIERVNPSNTDTPIFTWLKVADQLGASL